MALDKSIWKRPLATLLTNFESELIRTPRLLFPTSEDLYQFEKLIKLAARDLKKPKVCPGEWWAIIARLDARNKKLEIGNRFDALIQKLLKVQPEPIVALKNKLCRTRVQWERRGVREAIVLLTRSSCARTEVLPRVHPKAIFHSIEEFGSAQFRALLTRARKQKGYELAKEHFLEIFAYAALSDLHIQILDWWRKNENAMSFAQWLCHFNHPVRVKLPAIFPDLILHDFEAEPSAAEKKRTYRRLKKALRLRAEQATKSLRTQ